MTNWVKGKKQEANLNIPIEFPGGITLLHSGLGLPPKTPPDEVSDVNPLKMQQFGSVSDDEGTNAQKKHLRGAMKRKGMKEMMMKMRHFYWENIRESSRRR